MRKLAGSVIDILRRGGVDVDMVSVTGEKGVTSSHKVTIETDCLLEEVDPSRWLSKVG